MPEVVVNPGQPESIGGAVTRAGPRSPTFAIDGVQVGVINCFDHDFPDSSPRMSVLAGANLLAVPALDPAAIAHLRWQSLVFRAIENRVPIVKADIAFDSAIVNANGVVLDRVAVTDERGQEALLIADVDVGPRGAPFTAAGGYAFATLVILGLLARYVAHIALWRRDRGLRQ